MNSADFDYKLKKYIYKLKRAETSEEAELYQKKLQQYHKLNKNNQLGGDYESSIKEADDAFAKLTEKLTVSRDSRQLNKIFENNNSKIDKIF